MAKDKPQGGELAKALGDLSPSKVIQKVTRDAIASVEHSKDQAKKKN